MSIPNTNHPLQDIEEVLDTDVMLGRGRGTNHHNKRYRAIVEEHKEKYRNASRLEKPLIALDVVNIVRAWSPPGRFLKLDKSTGKWSDVGNKKAREKTSQALREPMQGEAPPSPCTQTRRIKSDLTSSSDSTRNQPEDEVVRKEPESEKIQSIGTLDFSVDDPHILDAEWETLEAKQDTVGTTALHLQKSLVIADQVDELPGVEPMDSDIVQLFATRNQEQHSSDPIPPPMPLRAPSLQDHVVMKRETSNQGIYEYSPQTKKRAFCCESKVAAAESLKDLFMDKVQKNKMCMQEFLFIANNQMGGWEKMTDQEDSKLPAPRPTTVERTASEQFEYELLSPQDFHQSV